jgi:hypothetical protein
MLITIPTMLTTLYSSAIPAILTTVENGNTAIPAILTTF